METILAQQTIVFTGNVTQSQLVPWDDPGQCLKASSVRLKLSLKDYTWAKPLFIITAKTLTLVRGYYSTIPL